MKAEAAGTEAAGTVATMTPHALPHWVVWCQDHLLLSFLIVGEAYLLGDLMTLGWVSSIQQPQTWGIFNGIGVVLFFLAGATAAGVALRCSVTAAAAFSQRRVGLGLFNLLGLCVFSGAEIWASLSERSANLHPTPADNAVLNALGFTGAPLSPTVVIVALILPFASLYWGFSQQQKAPQETTQERAEREARELAAARHKAAIAATKAAGRRQQLAAYAGRINPLEEASSTDGKPGDNAPTNSATESDGLAGVDGGATPPDDGGNGGGVSTRNRKARGGNGSGLRAVPSGQWTGDDLQRYAMAKWGVEVPEKKAVQALATLGNGARLDGVTGRPYHAHKRTVMAWVDRTYGASMSVNTGEATAAGL